MDVTGDDATRVSLNDKEQASSLKKRKKKKSGWEKKKSAQVPFLTAAIRLYNSTEDNHLLLFLQSRFKGVIKLMSLTNEIIYNKSKC